MNMLGWQLAWSRVRSRLGAEIVGALPIAMALTGILLFAPLTAIARELTVRHELQGINEADRSVTVAISPERRPTASERNAFDVAVRDRLEPPVFRNVIRSTVFRQLAAPNGSTFRLVGAEKLRDIVRLANGRWPARCQPTRCEVVAVQNRSPLAPKFAANHPSVVIVGNVEPTASFAFVGQIAPGPDEIMLIADGPDAVHNIQAFRRIRRTDAWTAPIIPEAVNYENANEILNRTADLRSVLDTSGLSVQLPDQELLDALARAKSSSENFLLPAVQLLVLLLAATVLAGLLPQRELQGAVARLQRRGARARVQHSYRWATSVIVVVFATVVSVPITALLTWIAASALHAGPADALRSHLRLQSVGVLCAAFVVLVILLSMVLGDRADRPVLRFGRLRVSDAVIVLAMVVLAVFASARTPSNGEDTQSTGGGWVWLIVIGIAATWCVVRLRPNLRFKKRFDNGDQVRALLRQSTMTRERVALGASVLLALTASTAALAIAGRQTVRTNAQDQAAWLTGLDHRLTTGDRLVRPQELVASTQWKSIQSTTVHTNIVRRGANLLTDATDGTIEVLGLDPEILASANYWRAGDGPSPASIARRLAADRAPNVGALIANGAERLDVNVEGDIGRLSLAAVIQQSDGRWHELELTPQSEFVYSTKLEPTDGGGRFIGLRVALSRHQAERTEHHIGEAGTFTAPDQVDLTLVAVSAVGPGGSATPVRIAFDSFESSQARVRVLHTGLEIRAALEGQSALVLSGGTGSGGTGSGGVGSRGTVGPIPAIVDTRTAQIVGGVDATFVVDVLGRRSTFRVAGIAKRFPTVENRFLVAPISLVSREYDYAQPGAGTPAELWIAHKAVTARTREQTRKTLAGPPFDQVARIDRAKVEHDLTSDPVRRMTTLVLLGASFLGLALTIAAIYRSVRFAIDDAAGFRRSLQAHGQADPVTRAVIAGISRSQFLSVVPLGFLLGVLTLFLVRSELGEGASRIVPESVLPTRVLVPLGGLAVTAVMFCVAVVVATAIGSRFSPAASHSDLLREQ